MQGSDRNSSEGTARASQRGQFNSRRRRGSVAEPLQPPIMANGPPRQGQVRQRRRRSPAQHVQAHVEPSAATLAAMEAEGVVPVMQSVPVMRLEDAVEAKRRPLPVRARHTPSGKGVTQPSAASSERSRWQRLFSSLFSREEFEDFDSSFSGAELLKRITDSRRRVAHFVGRLPLPDWAQAGLFDILDFLMRKRVLFVLLLLICLLVMITPDGMVDDVAGSFVVEESSRPGLVFFDKYNNGHRTLPRRHPVAIVPGFITGALEMWESALPCLRQKSFSAGFRQRMFSPQMIYLILSDPQCWLDVFSMDKKTGLDRNDTKVRADMGFTSIDYFLPGYWVWAKVFINLADIGYDPQSMAVMTYDWRLSPQKAHERDGLFYLMRNNLRFLCQKNRQRAVVISHSYGTTVALAFFRWAERREGGFMDRHVAYYVNVGGVSMGISKAASALLLGDARDTLNVPWAARKVLDSFISQEARYGLLRSWSCLVSMLPRGCEEAWPSLVVLPNGTSLGPRGTAELIRGECRRSGHEHCTEEIDTFLETIDELPSLPQAPNTSVVCLYGIGVPSEAGYYLMDNAYETRTVTPYVGNASVISDRASHGVRLSDGDETVPLLSLAYMCRAVNGWRRNVGRVVTREFNHSTTNAPMNLRGGKQTARHVDILGNYDMLETILKIASGVDEEGVANPAQDEFHYTDKTTGETTKLQRSVHDRIYSDVDFIIRSNLRGCLRKRNKPIQPIPNYVDDNDFVWSGIRTSARQETSAKLFNDNRSRHRSEMEAAAETKEPDA